MFELHAAGAALAPSTVTDGVNLSVLALQQSDSGHEAVTLRAQCQSTGHASCLRRVAGNITKRPHSLLYNLCRGRAEQALQLFGGACCNNKLRVL